MGSSRDAGSTAGRHEGTISPHPPFPHSLPFPAIDEMLAMKFLAFLGRVRLCICKIFSMVSRQNAWMDHSGKTR